MYNVILHIAQFQFLLCSISEYIKVPLRTYRLMLDVAKSFRRYIIISPDFTYMCMPDEAIFKISSVGILYKFCFWLVEEYNYILDINILAFPKITPLMLKYYEIHNFLY